MQEQQFGCVVRSVVDWTALESGRYEWLSLLLMLRKCRHSEHTNGNTQAGELGLARTGGFPGARKFGRGGWIIAIIYWVSARAEKN
jgi:hypothetical protein